MSIATELDKYVNEVLELASEVGQLKSYSVATQGSFEALKEQVDSICLKNPEMELAQGVKTLDFLGQPFYVAVLVEYGDLH
jgi:hypothetical protein